MRKPEGLSRRALGAMLPAFAAYALLREAQADAPSHASAARWIARQDEIARVLRAEQMTPLAWQGEVEQLAREVDLAELVTAVNAARLVAAGTPFANDPAKRYVRFIDETGAPRRLSYGAALFAFAPHNVITPHGHKHMVSAHMVVEGAFRVRNFDRVRDEDSALIIRPTRDYIARLGDISTMSSQRDNIHWFVPQGPAMTFDVIIDGLDAGESAYDICAVDPLGGHALADGLIRAPVIGFDESARRYTSDV